MFSRTSSSSSAKLVLLQTFNSSKNNIAIRTKANQTRLLNRLWFSTFIDK
jgi:hypothetical protein